MNNPDRLADELTRQLHAQVDHWHEAPLSLDDVQGTARTIRRRRRALATGVAAVAVLAVAIPAGLSLTDGPTRISPAPAPTPSEAIEPTPNEDGSFRLTLDVPEGEVPATGFLSQGELVTPNGTVDLPGDFVQLAPYDGGWVGIRAGDLPPLGAQVVVLDADLQELSAVASNTSLVISPDGSRVAWVEAAGNEGDWTVVNAPTDGGEQIRTPTQPNTQVEGFIADDTVATSFFDDTTGDTYYGQATPEGEFDAIPLAGYQRVGGLSATSGLVAGQTKFLGDRTCSEVRHTDSAREQLVYKTCDYQLADFSPDGRWLIGYSTYYDLGSPTLTILDAATGVPIVEYVSSRKQADAAVVHAAAWEDEDTVLAVVEQGGQQAVLRLEADGTATRVSGVRDSAMTIEFFLPQHLFGQ
jgi:hypothetical protein